MNVNQVILIGNLGADAQVRALETGVKMARFRLATTEQFIRQDGQHVSHTEWHAVVAWRDVATYVEQNLRCGSLVRVEGRLRSRETTDPITLTVVRVYEIIAQSVQLLSNDAITIADERDTPTVQPRTAPIDVDNIPF